MILFLQLFLAHILGDFFLQNNKWVGDKESLKWRSPYLYIHVLIHFWLILLVTWNIDNWKIAFLIMLSHLLIDGVKLQFQQAAYQRAWFFGDQLAHLAVIGMVWAFHEKITWRYADLITVKGLIICIASLFVLKPASIITKNTISRWTPNSDPGQPISAIESLKDAGEWIGFLERLMILTFILMGKWEGVGFLLAAKSVFRFGDLKEPKETKLTEYVVIGTFLSFFLAIMTGLLSSYLLSVLK
ncbi:DUF3307 domain-containing protein [Chitinophaga filiformis]|uniref:DUF3307 domain-containing protein n=1 Tax=Chitinophaga filiformis TaxID=104663 RepID=A0ABY4I1W1_CHIFI|nr:DUF3307 domain-containing protein [Chitinophaga filiformis]UPK69269.1 DUF3307 domain-containing protein [Chitinophaga filiformis]